MSVMRSVLLAISENRWMRERGPRLWFVKRAARRFMPGEAFDDMLRAADELRPLGIEAVFTRLGENVTDAAEASAVTRHYLEVLDAVASKGIRCEPSIKLTQLGLDLGAGAGLREPPGAGRAIARDRQLPLDRHGADVVRGRHARADDGA